MDGTEKSFTVVNPWNGLISRRERPKDEITC